MKRLKSAWIVSLLAAAVIIIPLSGCGEDKVQANYKDGNYTGRSSDFKEDESGNGAGYGEVEIEVKSNKVVSCSFKMYELDGTLKDENYDADLSKENRLKAQKAVQSADKYSTFLTKSGSIDNVDVISGATISYKEFVEAVNDALNKAVVSE